MLTPVEYIEWQALKIVNKIWNENYPVNKEIFDNITVKGNRSSQNCSITVQKVFSQVRKESFAIRIVEDWNNMDPSFKTGPFNQFAEYSKNFVRNKHRGDVVPNTRARVSQRTPYY